MNKKEWVWLGKLKLNVNELNIIDRGPGLFGRDQITFLYGGILRQCTVYNEEGN